MDFNKCTTGSNFNVFININVEDNAASLTHFRPMLLFYLVKINMCFKLMNVVHHVLWMDKTSIPCIAVYQVTIRFVLASSFT